MSLHDEYARVTPYEIAFPDPEAVQRLVSDVTREATALGVDPEQPGVFAALGSVGDFARGLKAPGAPEEADRQLGALLFHVVHFVRAGLPLHLLETAATRNLVERAPAGVPNPPSPAGYLQLPQHLFWMDRTEEGTPESIDGLFWVATDAGTLHVLPITGVLPDRMAFRALPLAAAPTADAREWLEADVRREGHDYDSSLPGHDLDGLYAMETAGEVLKLLARFFAYVDAVPSSGTTGESPPQVERSAPRPSRLAYTRVRLVA